MFESLSQRLSTTVQRLRGRGRPGATPGDQIVEIEIVAPAPHNERQRAAYEDLKSAFSAD